MNKTIIDNALNDISPEFMEEYADSCAIEATARPGRVYRRIIPILAAAAAAVIAVSAFAVAQFAKTPPIPAPVGVAPVESAFSVPEDAVSPAESSTVSLPAESSAVTQIEENNKNAFMGARVYTGCRFKDGFEDSDLVAHVRVIEQLGELDEWSTLYKIELLEVFKGDVQDKIIFMAQMGSKKMLFNMDLFKPGEEYLLYLLDEPLLHESSPHSFFDDALDYLEKELEDTEKPTSYKREEIKQIYLMNGINLDVVDVIYADGEMYFCDRFGLLTSDLEEVAGTDYTSYDEALLNKLIDSVESDSAQAYFLKYRCFSNTKLFIMTHDELVNAIEMIKKQ